MKIDNNVIKNIDKIKQLYGNSPDLNTRIIKINNFTLKKIVLKIRKRAYGKV